MLNRRFGLLLFLPAVLSAQTVTLDPLTVSASRASEPLFQVPFAIATFTADDLHTSAASTLDGALKSVPAFSLFRRSDSLTANPTAQGVSLRGLGPSGASRSLVLLDGVPLNDPFGGWVLWSKIPRESLAGVEIVRGGGATAWGNAALGGVIQILTENPADAPNRIAISGGDFSTHSGELSLTQHVGRGTLQLGVDDFGTSGFSLVAAEDRGPIDVAAWSRHEWYSARWQQPVGSQADLTITARTFDEQRGNGTPYQGNRSRENFGSATLNVRPDKNFTWNATVYAQDEAFSSTFSSVNATRTAETPASNQYAVPATALGAAWSGVWVNGDQSRTSAGVDFRDVSGETREYYTYTNSDFTRQRIAGGTQDFAGIFALHEQQLGAAWRASVGARLDFWQDRDGHRHEIDHTTGAVLRDDHYASLDGVPVSPSAGLIWQPSTAWRIRASGQKSFRRPTLNELYRPFRVGNIITEANPNLRTEHATSFDLGLDYTREKFTFTTDLFWNDLRDAVGSVTLAQGPGTFPIVGFVPAGGLGRQRQNIDNIHVRGIEFGARFEVSAAFRLDVSYLLNDSDVISAANAPVLIGKRLAEVPRNTLSAGILWRAPSAIKVSSRLRWVSAQFEDDENTLPLAAATTVDLELSHAVGQRGEFFIGVENLFSVEVETGRVTNGIVSIGPPRLARGGVRWAW
ncbi:MAG TPA: TonB-dependent receptor [Lacunisphaera sp.]|jgi:outer membrane receptor protein involved in Fe transport